MFVPLIWDKQITRLGMVCYYDVDFVYGVFRRSTARIRDNRQIQFVGSVLLRIVRSGVLLGLDRYYHAFQPRCPMYNVSLQTHPKVKPSCRG